MKVMIREFKKEDLEEMIDIWNEIIRDGEAFPQEEYLTLETGLEFFKNQTYTGVAVEDGEILGLYILHPNNVGRCSHIANASYAVKSDVRGKHIGEKLVLDSVKKAREYYYRILQFNAVVESNYPARHLYEKIGFKKLGLIPDGFRMKDGHYENIIVYYIEL